MCCVAGVRVRVAGPAALQVAAAQRRAGAVAPQHEQHHGRGGRAAALHAPGAPRSLRPALRASETGDPRDPRAARTHAREGDGASALEARGLIVVGRAQQKARPLREHGQGVLLLSA